MARKLLGRVFEDVETFGQVEILFSSDGNLKISQGDQEIWIAPEEIADFINDTNEFISEVLEKIEKWEKE